MASKRRLRRRACGRKVKHTTKANATAHAVTMNNRGYNLVPYSCKFCGGWHVGRPDRKTKRKLRAARAARLERSRR